MAQKIVQLKNGQDQLFPVTKPDAVEGLIKDGLINPQLLPQIKSGIDIKYNNGIVQTGVTEINFAGTVTVEADQDTPGVVKVRVGENQNSSNFNTKDGVTDGTVSYSGVTTKNMIMVTPSGTTWGIGNWEAGSTQKGFNASTATTQSITVTTAGKIHFADEVTSFTAKVIDWNSNVVAQATFDVAIDGTVTKTGAAGITMTLANFGTETNAPAAVGYEGKPTFSFDMKSVLPSGGRFHFEVSHQNGLQGTFNWAMQQLFYNVGVNPAVAVPAISLVEGYTSTALSGVNYIDAGTIKVTNAKVSNLNKLAATTGNKVAVSGSYVSYTYAASHLKDYALTQSDSTAFEATASIASNKFVAGNVSVNMNASNAFGTCGNVASNALNLLVDTLAQGTVNGTTETFKTQEYRKTSALGQWDSTQLLTANDGLQQINKSLKYPTADYSAYTPAGPDYSGLTGWRYYIRPFTITPVREGGTVTLTGLAQSDIDATKLKIQISTDGSTWYDITQTSANGGIRIYPDTVKLPKLQFSLQNANEQYYIRIGMTQAFTKSITALSFV